MTAGVAEVDRKIDSGVTDIRFRHATQDVFNGFGIVNRRRIELHIADMTGIGVFVIDTFTAHFFKGADRVTDWYMEGVAVILAIGNTRDDPVFLAIHPDKTTG